MFEPRDVKRFRRELEAWIAKAGRDDPAAFAQIVQVLDDTPAMLAKAAWKLRNVERPNLDPARQRYSWADIGAALGVHRSSAQQRFGRRSDL